MNDIWVYGESDSPDCPQNGQGGFCFKPNKMAFLSSVSAGGKPLFITKPSALPPEKIKVNAGWSINVKLNRIKFIDFKKTTREGMPNHAFQLMKTASDMIGIQKFYDTEFINCDEEAIGYFFDPP